MSLYTVFDPSDYDVVYGRGLTAVEAMKEILTYDGRAFEIRADTFRGSTVFDLWSKNPNSKWVKTGLFAFADTAHGAELQIAKLVIYADWPNHPQAILDEDFDLMIAEFSA